MNDTSTRHLTLDREGQSPTGLDSPKAVKRMLAESAERLVCLKRVLENGDASWHDGHFRGSSEHVFYETIKGEFSARPLLEAPDVSVRHAVLTPDTRLTACTHSFKEWLIIHDGELIVDCGEGIRSILSPGDSLTVEPGIPHALTSDKGAGLVIVAWPGDMDDDS